MPYEKALVKMVTLTIRWLSGDMKSYEGCCVADIIDQVTDSPPYLVLFFYEGELVTYYRRFYHDTQLDIVVRELPSIYIQFDQNGKEYYANLFHPLDVYEGKATEGRIFVDYQSYGHALGDLNGGKDRLCYRDFLYFCKTIQMRNKMAGILSWSEYIRLGSFLLPSPIIDVVFPIDSDVKKYGRMTAEKWYQWFTVK